MKSSEDFWQAEPPALSVWSIIIWRLTKAACSRCNCKLLSFPQTEVPSGHTLSLFSQQKIPHTVLKSEEKKKDFLSWQGFFYDFDFLDKPDVSGKSQKHHSLLTHWKCQPYSTNVDSHLPSTLQKVQSKYNHIHGYFLSGKIIFLT